MSLKKIIAKVAIEFIKRKVYSCCLIASIILKEKLHEKGIETTLVEGYQVFEHKYTSRHYWLEYNDTVIDIGNIITNKITGKEIPDRFLDKLLDHRYQRIDNETRDECLTLREMEYLFNIYTNDNKNLLKKFWNQVPTWMIIHRKRIP